MQGIGAALLTPGALALIGATFPPEERGKAFGTWAGAGAMFGMVGPLVGGWLADQRRLALHLLDQCPAGGLDRRRSP